MGGSGVEQKSNPNGRSRLYIIMSVVRIKAFFLPSLYRMYAVSPLHSRTRSRNRRESHELRAVGEHVFERERVRVVVCVADRSLGVVIGMLQWPKRKGTELQKWFTK